MAPMSVSAHLAGGGATASVLISVRSYSHAVRTPDNVVISATKSTSVIVNQVRQADRHFELLSVADSGFSKRGAQASDFGAKTYYLARLCRKLHENERNLTKRGSVSLTPPPLIRQ